MREILQAIAIEWCTVYQGETKIIEHYYFRLSINQTSISESSTLPEHKAHCIAAVPIEANKQALPKILRELFAFQHGTEHIRFGNLSTEGTMLLANCSTMYSYVFRKRQTY